MKFLIGIISICIVHIGPEKPACKEHEVWNSQSYSLFACEGIMDREAFKMRTEIARELKPNEMLVMSYQCLPREFQEQLDKT